MNQQIEETQEINEQGQIIITRTVFIKKPVSESQRRAAKKYQQKNKEKHNELSKQGYRRMKERDPEFLEKKRVKNREYYYKTKLEKLLDN